ncbi:solute carrier family 22 member 13-like [Haemaphysalis longicornis]
MAVLVGYMCGSVVVAFLMVLKIDWKTMQVISMLPGLMMLSLFRKIVESPRWLIARGSLDEAEAVIIYAVTLNGENIIEARQLWARTRREIERARSEVPTEVCCCELFRVQGSCRRSIILFYCWSVMAFAVNATYFDINSLNFHPSLMLVLGAVLTIPAEICAIVFAARLGRCASQAGGLACTAVVCFVVNLISEEHVITRVALLLMARLSVKASLSIAALYTAEVYPTVARCSGLGLCNCFVTAANIAMPLFAYMVRIAQPSCQSIDVG